MEKERIQKLNQLPFFKKWGRQRKKIIIPFSLFLGIGLLSFIFPKNSPAPEESPSVFTKQGGDFALLPPVEYEVRRNDTLENLLTKAGANYSEVHDLAGALRPLVSPRSIRGGEKIELRFFTKGGLATFKYIPSPIQFYEVTKEETGFVAKKGEIPLETRNAGVSITLNSSLYQDLLDAGEKPALVSLLLDILAWDVDFFADPRSGDVVSLIVEKKYVQGEFYDYGKILAVDYNGKIVQKTAFYFDQNNGYFDKNGDSLARNFLKSPVKYTRISSKFGNRRHPVTHTFKQHLGTDYAAPVGTPVWAIAEGRVMERTYNPFNGRYIVVKHPNGYSSYYLHLSRYQKGVVVGKRVQQKELIGYVGTTGRSSGPHLHLSMKYGGQFIDPLKLKKVKQTSLTGEELIAFQRVLPQKMEALAQFQKPRSSELVLK
ncbi:MAG: peptidoglycan DD-metalloendopeptidase family protein [bacterium]|nr:peptidoglycan DD-metalloendopeptidase family protein [bacterium]